MKIDDIGILGAELSQGETAMTIQRRGRRAREKREVSQNSEHA